MHLSPIKTDDFAQWLQMRNEVYGALGPDFHEKEMESILDREDWFCYFLIDSNNNKLGFVELSARNVADGCLSSPVAYIEGLFIEKKYRNKGRGKAAVELILSWCKKHDFTEIAADAELTNEFAQEFFKSVGFRETFRIVEFCRSVE